MRMDTSGRLLIGHNTYDVNLIMQVRKFSQGQGGKLFCTETKVENVYLLDNYHLMVT